MAYRLQDLGNSQKYNLQAQARDIMQQELGYAHDPGMVDDIATRLANGEDVRGWLKQQPAYTQAQEGRKQVEAQKAETTRQQQEQTRLDQYKQSNQQVMQQLQGTPATTDPVTGQVTQGTPGWAQQFQTGMDSRLNQLMTQIQGLQTNATNQAQLGAQDITNRRTGLQDQLTQLTQQLGLTPEGIQQQQSGLTSQIDQLAQQLGLTQGQRQQSVQDLLSQQLNQVAKLPFEQAQQAAMRAGESALEQRGLTRSGSAPELAQNVAGQIGMQRAQATQGAYGQANSLQQQLQQLASQFGQQGLQTQQQLAARLQGQQQQMGQFGQQLGQAQTSDDLGRLAQLVSQFSGMQGQGQQGGFNMAGQTGMQNIQNLLNQSQFGQGQNFQGGQQAGQNTFQNYMQTNQNQFNAGQTDKQNKFNLDYTLATTPKQEPGGFNIGNALTGLVGAGTAVLGGPLAGIAGGALPKLLGMPKAGGSMKQWFPT